KGFFGHALSSRWMARQLRTAASRFPEIELSTLENFLRCLRDTRGRKLSILVSRRCCPDLSTRIVISTTLVCGAKSRRKNPLPIGFKQSTLKRRSYPSEIISRQSRKVLQRQKDAARRRSLTSPPFQNWSHRFVHRFGRGGLQS